MSEDDTFDALKYRTYDADLKAYVWLNNAGQYHRRNGPAVEYADGTKVWCVNGKRHRTDGPAFEGVIGDVEYWIDGNFYTTQEYSLICRNIQRHKDI